MQPDNVNSATSQNQTSDQTTQSNSAATNQSVNQPQSTTSQPVRPSYAQVFKKPSTIIILVIGAVLYAVGMLQDNQDLQTYLRLPLVVGFPLFVGISIIKNAQYK